MRQLSAKFYDLEQGSDRLPEVQHGLRSLPVATRGGRIRRPRRPRRRRAAAAPAAEVATPETADAEFVSLEDADAEAQGSKKSGAAGEADIEEEEVEIDESLDDAAFIEEQEEEDADVTDIIGGDIENEEEG